MTASRAAWVRLKALLRAEYASLTTVNASDRGWQLPLAAALATGLPLLVGAWFGHLGYGLVSSLGGLVFLYTPNTPMSHRMVSLLASAFGLTSCYALGVLSQIYPPLTVLALAVIATLVTMVCRFYRVGPPGSLFFAMAAAIGAYSPVELLEFPLFVGLLALGCLLACAIAFFYSLMMLRRRAAEPVAPLPPASFDFVVFDSVVIGACVGLSLAIAQLLQLPRPYWVPVSCLAVIQGASFRAVWNRQVQRILGTAVGLLVCWGLLALPLDAWRISLVMMALVFIIESLVVRHYGVAAIFITPLTILLAEASSLGSGASSGIIMARLLDTVLGCLVGVFGGICLHTPRFRAVLGGWMRRLLPRRLLP